MCMLLKWGIKTGAGRSYDNNFASQMIPGSTSLHKELACLQYVSLSTNPNHVRGKTVIPNAKTDLKLRWAHGFCCFHMKNSVIQCCFFSQGWFTLRTSYSRARWCVCSCVHEGGSNPSSDLLCAQGSHIVQEDAETQADGWPIRLFPWVHTYSGNRNSPPGRGWRRSRSPLLLRAHFLLDPGCDEEAESSAALAGL